MIRKVLGLATVFGAGLLSLFVRGSEIDDANRLFVLEKYEDAVKIYETAISGENRKAAPEALFGIGRAYQMLNQWKAAREAFESILRDHPDSELVARSKIQIGQCGIKLGDLGKALAVFEDLEKRYAGEDIGIEAAYNIANINAGFFGDEVTNARSAIQGYRTVLQSDEGKRYATQSHFGLGQCYVVLRDYPRAIESFRAVIKEGPETVWAGLARDQIANVMRVLGGAAGMKRATELPEPWVAFQWDALRPFERAEGLAWQFAGTRPALRIRAVGFSTESEEAGSGMKKVFYLTPTIYYKNHVFRSDRGTVDRTNRSVVCIGNVRCTDGSVPPALMITSGAVTLDLGKNTAVFSRDVRFERRAGPALVQQLVVGELHLLLDSGKVEVPAE